MGVDLIAGGRKVGHKNRTAPKSKDVYLNMLVKLYRFLGRRTSSKFNKTVLKRLFMARRHTPPVSLSNIAKHMKGKEGKIAVIVGPVTNDERMMEIPKLKVAARSFTETARARIVENGGEVMTLDTLALTEPLGENTVLLRGKTSARTANRYFGLDPGQKGSHTRPRVRAKGRKFERARLRRATKN